MRSAGPYSLDLMTRVLLGLGPPATQYASCKDPEDPAPSWEEEVCGQTLNSTHSSSTLSDVVNTFDRQPVGWFPPLYPPPHRYVNQNLPPASTPTILDLHKLDTLSLDIRRDGIDSTSSESTSSTPTGSTFTRSPSPPFTIRGPNVGSVCRAEDENDSHELSPLQTLREKERKKIRQSSGVRPKVKAPQTRSLRTVEAPSRSSLEMVQCQWTGCTKRLHVDYVSVKHWGKHVREHYANQQDMIQCKWKGGCGAVLGKSSMWKHIVVHQPKFKIRCPRGCDVVTRGDMMRRHLRSCPVTSSQTAEEGESDEEEDTEVEEHVHRGGYDGDGEDNEEGGKD
ncbi:hypothetical protein BDM02DRAFT_3112279 [Thelephora ganbajun]|uniref:Uncharacterized protein n=1 Tax=Thelephora ganbajun TaxID=370292 RepID=A0ACB6ZLN3_THEGA|nr:hypothetical protein BDM02DRAFT_3112279 [Thelephora ganbajun]